MIYPYQWLALFTICLLGVISIALVTAKGCTPKSTKTKSKDNNAKSIPPDIKEILDRQARTGKGKPEDFVKLVKHFGTNDTRKWRL